jgi:hypothetical protein
MAGEYGIIIFAETGHTVRRLNHYIYIYGIFKTSKLLLYICTYMIDQWLH